LQSKKIILDEYCACEKQKIETENFQNFEKKAKILPKMTIFRKYEIFKNGIMYYFTVFSKQKVHK